MNSNNMKHISIFIRKMCLIGGLAMMCACTDTALENVLQQDSTASDGMKTATTRARYPQRAPLYWSVYKHCYILNDNQNTQKCISVADLKANIDYVAEHLKPYGYTMVCTDGWGDDWKYNEHGYRTFYSSKDHMGVDGKDWSYQEWSNYLKNKGMTLGVYNNPLWVSKVALEWASHYEVEGAPGITLADIVDQDDINNSTWFAWVQVRKPGAEQYVKNYIKFYADMGVTYLRVDFMSWFEDGRDRNPDLSKPTTTRTIEDYRTAIKWMHDACLEHGVTLSLVMPHLQNHAYVELQNAPGSLVRINDDVCRGGWYRFSDMDRGKLQYNMWPACFNMFDGFVHWSDIAGFGDGHLILDGDFTILSLVDEKGNEPNNDERQSIISLQIMAGAPIAIADEYQDFQNDNTLLQYYTNTDLLDLNKAGFVGQPLSRDFTSTDSEIWVGKVPNSNDWVVGLFNREGAAALREVDFYKDLGFTTGRVKDLWSKNEWTTTRVSESVPAHGCKIFRITPQAENYTGKALMLVGGNWVGWGNDALKKALPLLQNANDPAIYTYTGYFETGETFKFITEASWSGLEYRCAQNFDGNGYGKMRRGGTDDKFYITGDNGNYKITCNLRDLTIRAERMSYQDEKLRHAVLYMVGSATPGGWEMSDATPLYQDANDPWKYRANVYLTADGEFKIPINKHLNFDQYTYYKHNDQEPHRILGALTTDSFYPGDSKWTVPVSGNYEVLINIATGTISYYMSPVMLIGGASWTGWTLINACPLKQVGTDPIFTYVGWLEANQEFKFLTKTEWGQPEYRCKVNFNAGTVGYLKLGQGDTGDDKFHVSQSGNYKLTLDLCEMKITADRSSYQTTPLKVAALYMIGDATPGGWNWENTTPLYQDDAQPWLYKTSVRLNTGNFKFYINKYYRTSQSSSTAEWDQYGYFRGSSDSQIVWGTTDTTGDIQWEVTTAGQYDIVLNVENNTLTMTRK